MRRYEGNVMVKDNALRQEILRAHMRPVKPTLLTMVTITEPYSVEVMMCIAKYLLYMSTEKCDDLVVYKDTHKIQGLFAGIPQRHSRPCTVIVYEEQHHSWALLLVHIAERRILYVQPFGLPMSSVLKDALNTARPLVYIVEYNFGARSNDDAGSVHNISGIVTLRHLEILAKEYKSAALTTDAFERAELPVWSNIPVQECANAYFKKLLTQKLVQLDYDLRKASAHEPFMTAFDDFFTRISSAAELVRPVQKYSGMLQQYAAAVDRGEQPSTDELDQCLANITGHEFCEYLNNDGHVDAESLETHISIEQKFPREMTTVTEYFQLSVWYPQAAERAPSDILGINYEILEKFYSAKEVFNAAAYDLAVEAIPAPAQRIRSVDADGSTDADVKTLDEILDELVQHDSDDSDVVAPFQRIRLAYSCKSFTRLFKNKRSSLQASFGRVKNVYEEWHERPLEDVSKWAQHNAGTLGKNRLEEAIAVMDHTYHLLSGHRMRLPQILAVLLFMDAPHPLAAGANESGFLCQVQTGEGKTLVVAAIAALHVLMGRRAVDVITSNQVLAAEAVTEYRHFYAAFGITVATNVGRPNAANGFEQEEEAAVAGPQACYQSNVVYGDIGSFQFDYLRDTFEGQGTRNNRPFECVILDEVDSMLVDNGGNIAKLSDPFPGMEALRHIYIHIWMELHIGAEFEQRHMRDKLRELATELAAEDGIQNACAQERYDALRNELEVSSSKRIRDHIRRANVADNPLLPKHLRQYARDKCDRWIDNAILAQYTCRLNADYILDTVADGELQVVPVDYANTGVTLRNTVWCYGLHQFLQLKHNLRLTAEGLTSSCISNYGYIRLYGARIFGLTGTLGGRAECALLSEIYGVQNARIPPYKRRQFRELDGIIEPDPEWAAGVVTTVHHQLQSERAVLVVCRTIADVHRIEVALRALERILIDSGVRRDSLDIRRYRDERDSAVTRDVIEPGVVLVATNIAGRGTDLRTNAALERNGGLHVCVTFCPDNERVRDQVFYRTSRQGNAGTAQLVVRQTEVQRLLATDTQAAAGCHFSISAMYAVVEQLEARRVDNIRQERLPQILYHDHLFDLFSSQYQALRNQPSHDTFALRDLKEAWAFWLEGQRLPTGDDVNPTEEAKRSFAAFKEGVHEQLQGDIAWNPYYGILKAERRFGQNKPKEAHDALTHACILAGDRVHLLAAAYVKQAEATIHSNNTMWNRLKKALAQLVFVNGDITKNLEYKDETNTLLQLARTAILTELEYMEKHYWKSDSFTRIIVTDMTSADKNIFLCHLRSTYTCLQLQVANIDHLLQQLQTNDPALDVIIGGRVNIGEYIRTLEPTNDQERLLQATVHNTELVELQRIGLETLYAFRVAQDVPPQVLMAARIQVTAGITALTTGLVFPPGMFVAGPLAGVLITEGICDIVVGILAVNREFTWRTYLKGKVLSILIGIFSIGCSVIATCRAIMERAIAACVRIAQLLRTSTYMIDLCRSLAVLIDQIGVFLRYIYGVAVLKQTMSVSAHLFNVVERVTVGVALVTVTHFGLQETLHAIEEQMVTIHPLVANVVTDAVLQHLMPLSVNIGIAIRVRNLVRTELEQSSSAALAGVADELAGAVARHCTSWQLLLAAHVVQWPQRVVGFRPVVDRIVAGIINLIRRMAPDALLPNDHNHVRELPINGDDGPEENLIDIIEHEITTYTVQLIRSLALDQLNDAIRGPLLPPEGGDAIRPSISQRLDESPTNGQDAISHYCTILELERNDNISIAEVQNAFIRLAIQYAPETNTVNPPAAQIRLSQIRTAKDALIALLQDNIES